VKPFACTFSAASDHVLVPSPRLGSSVFSPGVATSHGQFPENFFTGSDGIVCPAGGNSPWGAPCKSSNFPSSFWFYLVLPFRSLEGVLEQLFQSMRFFFTEAPDVYQCLEGTSVSPGFFHACGSRCLHIFPVQPSYFGFPSCSLFRLFREFFLFALTDGWSSNPRSCSCFRTSFVVYLFPFFPSSAM